MAKADILGIRLNPAEQGALKRAASADDRPVSALARKVLVEWLRLNGWLEGEA